MSRVKENRIFFKYLFTYLILLFLPVIVMSALVHKSFVDRLQQEVIAGNLSMLDKVRLALDEQLKRVEDTTYQMALEENRLSQYRVSDNAGYKAWGIVSELKRYTSVNSFIQEIWLYYRGEESIYTNSSMYDLDVLANQVYAFADWPADDMVADLNESTEFTMMPPSSMQSGARRYLRLVVPILPNQSQPYATIVYLINERNIKQFLENPYNLGRSTWIFDANHTFITGVGEQDAGQIEKVSGLLREGASTYSTVRIDKEDHYLFVIESASFGWKYVTLLPVKMVLNSVQQAKQWFLYGMAAILLTGGLFVFVGMKMNYRPIRDLKLETEKLLASKPRKLSELETVRYAIRSLMEKNQELDRRLTTHSAAAKEQLLLSLLRGQITTEEDWKLFGEETGFPIRGSRFRIALLKGADAPDGKEWMEQIEQRIPAPAAGIAIGHVEPGRVIVLLIADGIPEEKLRKGLSVWLEALLKEAKGGLTIGIGSETDVACVPKSYLEADSALDYRFIQGIERVIYYEDIPHSTFRREWHLGEELEILRQSIRMGHADKAERSLKKMVTFIREEQPSLVIARGLCIDIIRTVGDTWDEMGLEDRTSPCYVDVFSLEHLETLDAFKSFIQALCRDLCAAMGQAEKPAEQDRSVERMKQYIEEYYRSCDFSFQGMAIHFGMALPNLSQYFRDQTGETLLEFTTRLRLEKAKELLLERDDILKVIAESVGYYNVSSFIRRFKQLTGMTPGEFRQIHKRTGV